MKSASIRRMRAEDVEEISSIYGHITKATVGPDFKRLVEEHTHNDCDAACFVAEQDNHVVGFMISYILPFGFGIECSAWIATMGVHPKYMGQGIGASMAKEILSFYKSRGISYVHTSVQWNSTDLLSFFSTLGFTRSDFINLEKTLQ